MSETEASEEPAWRRWKLHKFLTDSYGGNDRYASTIILSHLLTIYCVYIDCPLLFSVSNMTSAPVTGNEAVTDSEPETASEPESQCSSSCSQIAAPPELCGIPAVVRYRKRQKRKSDASKLSGMLKDIDNELEKKDDESHLYAMSVIEKLRRFTPNQRAAARRKIEEILFDIEFSSQPSTSAVQSMQLPTTPTPQTFMETTPHALDYTLL